MRLLLALLLLAPAATPLPVFAQPDSTATDSTAADTTALPPPAAADTATTAAAVPDSTADLVTLGFGWTPGLAATVTASQERVRYSPDDSTDTFVAASMRLTVTEADSAAGALQVGYADLALDRVVLPGDSARAAEALAVQQLAGLLPTFLVSEDGAFLGLADAETVQAALRSMVTDALAGADTADTARAFAESMLSEAALTAAAQQEWTLLVGFWDGAALDVGALYEMDDEAEMPGLPGVRMPLRVEFGVAGRLPCPTDGPDGAPADSAAAPSTPTPSASAAAGAPLDCVELVYRSYPEEDQMREVLATLFEALAPEQQEEARAFFDALRSLSAMTEVRLVTEPATLIPHALVRTKEVTLETATTAAEPAGTAYQFDQRAYRYRYGAPPSGADASGAAPPDTTAAPVDG